MEASGKKINVQSCWWVGRRCCILCGQVCAQVRVGRERTAVVCAWSSAYTSRVVGGALTASGVCVCEPLRVCLSRRVRSLFSREHKAMCRAFKVSGR